MSTIPINNYEEMAELLRDFMQDYSWLFNFSNINIILDDFVGKETQATDLYLGK